MQSEKGIWGWRKRERGWELNWQWTFPIFFYSIHFLTFCFFFHCCYCVSFLLVSAALGRNFFLFLFLCVCLCLFVFCFRSLTSWPFVLASLRAKAWHGVVLFFVLVFFFAFLLSFFQQFPIFVIVFIPLNTYANNTIPRCLIAAYPVLLFFLYSIIVCCWGGRPPL